MGALLSAVGSGVSSLVSGLGSLGSTGGLSGLAGSLMQGFTGLSQLNNIAGGGGGSQQNPLQALYPQQSVTPTQVSDNSYNPNTQVNMGQGFNNWQQGQASVSPFSQLVGSLLGK